MSGATAAHQFESLFRTLLLYKVAEVAVGYEKYLVAVELLDDLNCT